MMCLRIIKVNICIHVKYTVKTFGVGKWLICICLIKNTVKIVLIVKYYNVNLEI